MDPLCEVRVASDQQLSFKAAGPREREDTLWFLFELNTTPAKKGQGVHFGFSLSVEVPKTTSLDAMRESAITRMRYLFKELAQAPIVGLGS